jgi:hypothetical protein
MTAKKSKAGGGKIHLKWVRSAICAPVKAEAGDQRAWDLPG